MQKEAKMKIKTRILIAVLILLAAGAHAQQKKLKVYISVDMEGIGGVVTGEQLGPQGFEYTRFREFMTAEALAAVHAARDAGATEILVSDSHGNGQNLLIEKFPDNVRIIRAWPRRLSMMAGIDASFDAVLFIGYHSGAANTAGVRAHTFSSGTFTDVKLNGRSVSEGEWNAAIAGHFGVPVVMISGDDAAIAEVRRALGPIEGAEVKRALGFHAASNLTPQAAQALIAEKVKAALARRAEMKPYKASEPVRVEVSFKHYRPAEVLAYLPGVERVDAHTIRYTAKTMLEASDFMVFLTNYNPALEP
jgi:D-amino peptidase